ncbi:MAG: citramalate synthase [Deinococcaceae bacterium]
MSMPTLSILDTTLREGALAEDIVFSTNEKLRIAKLIDSLGVTYIEGGWPHVFEEDLEFFAAARDLGLNAKLTAFGATRRPDTPIHRDKNLKALLESQAPVIHIYGKVWTLHVEKVLQTTLSENLAMLRETIAFLKAEGKEVIYTAEHFFDGFRTDRNYSLENLQVALDAGADIITLGDSNGGSLPKLIREGITAAKECIQNHPLGLHLHNDLGLALANTLTGLEVGIDHIQGTINGYGARTGITDLTTLLPILKLKMDCDIVSDLQLSRLTQVANQIAEISGLGGEMDHRPIVGRKVFSHKTPTHVAAVLSDPESYEPIDPAKVGNHRRLLIPGLNRPTYLKEVARKFGVDLSENTAANIHILDVLRKLEEQGYNFEDAQASFELRLGRLTGKYQRILDTERLRLFEVIRGQSRSVVEASLKVRIDGHDAEYVAAEGSGPLDTLYRVVMEALHKDPSKHPLENIDAIRPIGYRVRTLSASKGHLNVRVALSFTDNRREWTTIGIEENVTQALWTALVDGIEYGLLTPVDVHRA